VKRHANELKHVGSLQSFTATGTDTHGQPTGSWATVSTVRLKIEPLTSRTAEYAHQLYELATHTLWLRYRTGVTSAQRIVIGSRTFNFGYVENVDEDERWLRILASEVVG
jgi:SPP1 family predicted phage head-tail adaptor